MLNNEITQADIQWAAETLLGWRLVETDAYDEYTGHYQFQEWVDSSDRLMSDFNPHQSRDDMALLYPVIERLKLMSWFDWWLDKFSATPSGAIPNYYQITAPPETQFRALLAIREPIEEALRAESNA